MHSACEQCEAKRAELAAAHAQIACLRQQVAELQAELAETIKLTELQQADLERYKLAYESSRPNHPERAPREQLQLAFERVIAALAGELPANEETEASEQSEGDATGELDGDHGHQRAKRKRRHKHGRRRLDMTNLPVIEQRVEPEEVSAVGGVGYQLIGEEISERVAYRRGSYVRHRLIRPKYVLIGTSSTGTAAGESSEEMSLSAAPQTELEAAASETAGDPSEDRAVETLSSSDDERVSIVISPLPDNIWPNYMADPSAIARVMLSKYGDILPLHRQETISARSGFALPRSTQCSWLRGAYQVTAPVVDAMFAEAKRTAFLIATDATGTRVLPPRVVPDQTPPPTPPDELYPTQRRRCDNWHVFVFIADRDHVVFQYDREHTGAVFARLLDGYRGNLLADAASVFDVLYREHEMIENGCWFHARRPFYRGLETDPQRALEALALIGKLFEVDRQLKADNPTLAEFTEQRAERSRPILKLLDHWVALHQGNVDPRGPLASGIGYYVNQRDALHRFLQDGRIRLDNNLSEQALRNVVLGQANWQFFANETGLKWYTTFRSLIASCALHRLNPEIYLEQLLRIVPHWPKHRVLELSPKYWLETVSKLEPTWRAMLEQPWEPGVVVSAEIPAPRRLDPAVERAA
jgi:transposase